MSKLTEALREIDNDDIDNEEPNQAAPVVVEHQPGITTPEKVW